DRDHLVDGERLRHDQVDAAPLGRVDIDAVTPPGDQYDGCFRARGLDDSRHVPARDPGRLELGDDEIEALLVEHGQVALDVGALYHVVPLGGERVGQEPTQVRVAVGIGVLADEEDP